MVERPPVHTIRAEFLNGYSELAREVGLDPLRMLDAVGIPRAAQSDPELMVPTSRGRDLLERSGRAAEDFGLRMSERRSPSIMGPVALIFREQPTLREALRVVERVTHLHTASNSARIEEVDDVAILYLTLSYPTPGPCRQATELSMGQIVQMYQRILGRGWRPLNVSFIHRRPRSAATHHRLFGPHVLFDQPVNALVCSRADLDTPNPHADPQMARQIGRYVESLMERTEKPLPEQVRDLVFDFLPTGAATSTRVAGQLGLDVRTLQRHLATAGTSFAEVLQAARRVLSDQYLAESDRPLAEVAGLLGFSATSAFSRWHMEQYGCSPSARRDAARAG